jgi:hypothetical protein
VNAYEFNLELDAGKTAGTRLLGFKRKWEWKGAMIIEVPYVPALCARAILRREAAQSTG